MKTVTIIIGAASLAACSTGGQKLTRSGFLPGYDQLERMEKHRNAAVWVAPNHQPSRYAAVIVAPVEWRAEPRDAAIQQRLQGAFREALIEQLGKHYRVVDRTQPGIATLCVRAAITNVRRTRWYLNAPAQVASTLTFGAVSVVAPLQGGATQEMAIDDAATGKPLVRMVSFRNGKKWDFKGAYVAYDHARQAFRQSAQLLAAASTHDASSPVTSGQPAYKRTDG